MAVSCAKVVAFSRSPSSCRCCQEEDKNRTEEEEHNYSEFVGDSETDKGCHTLICWTTLLKTPADETVSSTTTEVFRPVKKGAYKIFENGNTVSPFGAYFECLFQKIQKSRKHQLQRACSPPPNANCWHQPAMLFCCNSVLRVFSRSPSSRTSLKLLLVNVRDRRALSTRPSAVSSAVRAAAASFSAASSIWRESACQSR